MPNPTSRNLHPEPLDQLPIFDALALILDDLDPVPIGGGGNPIGVPGQSSFPGELGQLPSVPGVGGPVLTVNGLLRVTTASGRRTPSMYPELKTPSAPRIELYPARTFGSEG